MLRSSFWPAKLRWLRRTQPRLFARVVQWVSPTDWIWNQLFGTRGTSVSMASATGLYNQAKQTWDEELCACCHVRNDQLFRISQSARLTRKQPNELRDAEIFHAIGDGAASNLGSGADGPGLLALNVGTSAAVRAMQKTKDALRLKLPFGLFRYALDGDHSLIGGAVSNAGNLRAWCMRELRLRDSPQAVRRAFTRASAAEDPICVLPFWVNERAPSWPEQLGGTVLGLTQATTAEEIFRATTTSVFNRLAQIITLTESVVGKAQRVIVSGGILQSLPALQFLSDVIARDIELCPVPEASLRGAAVYALKTLGYFPAPLGKGRIVRHEQKLASKHRRRRARQVELEKLLERFSATFGDQ